jgi:hypothetical protein
MDKTAAGESSGALLSTERRLYYMQVDLPADSVTQRQAGNPAQILSPKIEIRNKIEILKSKQ